MEIRRSATLLVMLALAALGGAALRAPDLANRPMHADEAVHAIKFSRLLEAGDYRYDPHEYHGPSLNYLSLPLAWLGGARDRTEVTAHQLRRLPAGMGLLLVILVWRLRGPLGGPATAVAAALAATSPALVFFSRYYIQEMLLATFTLAALGCFWRWQETVPERNSPAGVEPGVRRVGWREALLLGLSAGMMWATKETWVLAGLALAAAAVGVHVGRFRRRWPLRQLAAVVLVAGLVSAMFHSSFLQNPRGVVDSFTTYAGYLRRAGGEGSAGRHVHPWYQYLQWLFWQRIPGTRWGSEVAVGVLAAAGLWVAFRGRGLSPRQLALARFLALYTLVLLAIYSALPYKTPWCAVGPLHGLVLIAGIGAGAWLRGCQSRGGRLAVGVLIAAAVLHQGWQAWHANFVAHTEPRSPWVYAHTTGEVAELVDQVRQVAARHPDGTAMHVQVICPEDDYWPLPWCLRDFSRIGWHRDEPQGPPAPLIIIQPALEPMLLEYLYARQPPGQRGLYVPLAPPGRTHYLLRPGVPLRVFVRWDL